MANAAGNISPTLQNNPISAGYKDTHLFNLTAGTMIYDTNVQLNISNVFDKKPRPGGYDIRDPRGGFGTFSPVAPLAFPSVWSHARNVMPFAVPLCMRPPLICEKMLF